MGTSGMPWSLWESSKSPLSTCRRLSRYRSRLEISRARQGGAYGNIGNALDSLSRYDEAIEHHKKHLEISQPKASVFVKCSGGCGNRN